MYRESHDHGDHTGRHDIARRIGAHRLARRSLRTPARHDASPRVFALLVVSDLDKYKYLPFFAPFVMDSSVRWLQEKDTFGMKLGSSGSRSFRPLQ
jgi:hypothetical protein